MLESSEDLLKLFSFIPISVIVVAIVNLVNHWNETIFERLLMTNFQKVKNYASASFVFTCLFTLIIIVVFLVGDSKLEVNQLISGILKQVEDKKTIVLLIIFSVMYCVFLLSPLIIWIPSKVFSIKPDFYFRLDEEKRKWFIFRRTGKEELLLKSDDNNYMVIDDWNNKRFIRTVAPLNKWQNILYVKSNVRAVIVVFFVLLASVVWAAFKLDDDIYNFISFILILIIFSSGTQYWYYRSYYKKIKS